MFIGVPVIVVWLQHETRATVRQDWSPAVIAVLIFGVACLLLECAVRARCGCRSPRCNAVGVDDPA
jgi:hypothetical protein